MAETLREKILHEMEVRGYGSHHECQIEHCPRYLDDSTCEDCVTAAILAAVADAVEAEIDCDGDLWALGYRHEAVADLLDWLRSLAEEG